MNLIYTNKPVLKEAPRNRPAPAINPRLQETLTRIGGTVPEGGGVYAGMPVWRLAHGQTEQHFSRGKMRLRFPDEDVPPVLVQERFFVAPGVFERAARWVEARDQKRLERFLNFDYTIFAENEPLSSYLKQNESSLDYMQLADATGSREEVAMDVLGIASSAAPKNWIYLCDVKEVIEIGRDCWYVMRWIPASSHGGRKAWNDMRYSQDAYVPELNAIVPMIDDLGEFPEFGFWIPRVEIAEYIADEYGRMHPSNYCYTEPVEANCIEPVVEMLYERARLSKQDLNPEWRAKVQEENLVKQQQQLWNDTRKKVSDMLGVDAITINQ